MTQVCVITGGAAGIGLAFANTFLNHSPNNLVTILDRTIP